MHMNATNFTQHVWKNKKDYDTLFLWNGGPVKLLMVLFLDRVIEEALIINFVEVSKFKWKGHCISWKLNNFE